MTQLEKEGLVFQFLYQSSKIPSLEKRLPVEPDRLIRWIRGQEKIDDFQLNRCLRLFKSNRNTFDYLCSVVE